ncbi:MAG: thioredoxin family protein, partial [Spirochaetaceae bacterium]|nr:thioredoxin family protein [Spirochaetaceae bacterium]
EKYAGKAKFCSFNIDGARRVAMKEQVLGLPTMIIYVDGQRTDSVTGSDLTINQIEDMVKKYIS